MNDGCGVAALPDAKASGSEARASPEQTKDDKAATAEDATALVEAAVADAEADFARVRKNRVACLSLLCRHMQRIERVWGEDADLRQGLLCALSSCLGSLASHDDKVLRELSSLAPKLTPSASLRHFLTICLPVERQHTRGLRDDEFLVLRPDDVGRADSPACPGGAGAAMGASGPEAPVPGRQRMPLVVVMDHLRSAFNVGAIFRSAECLRVSHLHLCGYTATPDESRGQTGRAAMGADVHVPWSHSERTKDVLRELSARGIPVFALETVEGAESVHAFEFPQPCALLLGNERHGIEADLLALCTAPVRIPCYGVKNSLNVSVAFAICAYEIARQWQWTGGDSCTDES